jgi:cytochrome P450
MSDLSEAEVLMLSMALLIGGFETTAAAIDNGALALLRTGPPATWPAFPPATLTSEMLRYDSPAQLNPGVRLAAHDIALGGVLIPAGSDVRAVIGAANRDPAAFPGPDQFDPGRAGPPVLTFGAGPHFCPGGALARLEMRVLFPMLIQHLPALQLAGEPARRPSTVLRAVDDLPVTLGSP